MHANRASIRQKCRKFPYNKQEETRFFPFVLGHANSTTKISNLNTSSTTLYWDTTADIPTTLTDWRITYFRNNNRSYIDNDYLTPLSYDSEAEYIKERDKMQMMSDAEPTQYETLYW